MVSGTLAEGKDAQASSLQSEAPEDRRRPKFGGGRPRMQAYIIALILVGFALFQVAAYTAFRLAKFEDFTLGSYLSLVRDAYFWAGFFCSIGVFIFSFTLVRISESSLVLVLFLYMNSILVYFVFLPLTWRVVFNEQIFTSSERSLAYFFAVLSGIGLLVSMYLWNRGGN